MYLHNVLLGSTYLAELSCCSYI